MDVVSDVLRVTQMGNTIMSRAQFVAPWGIAVDESTKIAVHAVQRGHCWLGMPDKDPILLEEGDIVLIAHHKPHSLSDSPDTLLSSWEHTLSECSVTDITEVEGRAIAQLLCAKYRFGLPTTHPLFTQLPNLIHLRASDAAQNPQLQLLVKLMKAEVDGAGDGSDLVIPRLVDSLLVFILRSWLAAEPEMSSSWFAATRNKAIATALSAIHADPAREWSLVELAQISGQSRATFARQFAALVGETPMAYLNQWRLCVAAKRIRGGSDTIESVAYSSGYNSAAAFSRAFKRQYGFPPVELKQMTTDRVV